MSFHPNDVVRRGRAANVIIGGVLFFLLTAFFRAQVIHNEQSLLQSEENRLRQIPTAAPRGVIYDRNNKLIAENVVGYSVALLAQNEDTLRATLTRLRKTINLTDKQFEDAVRRFRRDRTRPTAIVQDASFDVVSVLEEHRMEFPSLIIQTAPKRIYPNGEAVGPFVGYIQEINEGDLANAGSGYKPGQVIGRTGLEKQYEGELRGQEGIQFVEVDARNRIVRNGRAREDVTPQEGKPLYTNIDLDLQEYIHTLFADTLSGAVVAMVPKTGEVLAIYSSPSIDPNRFVGGVSSAYYDSLQKDPRQPMYNKAVQGQYAPGSTFKLATSEIIALEDSLITFDTRMPQPCTGYYYFGNRTWHCWKKEGHGSVNLAGAIAQSCDVYFYQLGQKVGLTRLVAGGIALGFDKKSGIDLPEEKLPKFPTSVPGYFDQKYGARGWTEGSHELNLSIGQGDNSQTVINVARFYSALATDGSEPTPMIKRGATQRTKRFQLDSVTVAQLRRAMMGVVAEGGTAAAAAISGVKVAGKTGTAQTMRFSSGGKPLYYAWFAGMAPADDPSIVVVVMVPNVTFEGATSAGLATKIIAHYLHKQVANTIANTG